MVGRNRPERKGAVEGVSQQIASRSQGQTRILNIRGRALRQRLRDRRGNNDRLSRRNIHAARAQGWEIAGLNFPAHFLLRITASEGSAVVDPFDGARILEADDLGRLYADIVGESGSFDPERIPVMGNRDVLLRLQNNIKLRALRDGRAERAIEVLESMAAIAPAIGRLWWELAALLVQSGRLKRAIETLDAALERAGTPAARAEIESLLRRTRDSLN